jgi:hypothetical protein
VESDLEALARGLGSPREAGVPPVPVLGPDSADSLDAAGDAGEAARAALAGQLQALLGSASELSDRISHRYFSLVEIGAHALAS